MAVVALLGVATVGAREAAVVHVHTGPAMRWNCGDVGYQIGGTGESETWPEISETIECDNPFAIRLPGSTRGG